MTWSRAPLRAVWCGSTLAAFGCAQIAGLTDDYHLAAGAGGSATAGAGGSAAQGGLSAHGGSAGQAPGEAGNAGDAPGGSTSGGSADGSSANAGTTNGGSANGGSANAGATNGGAANAGSANAGTTNGGSAGASGGSGGNAGGITRIGFSEFHDSASGSDQASSHLADASFSKPAGTAPGDFILVFFGCDHGLSNLSGNDLLARGWTLIDQHENYGTDGQGAYLLYKFADGSEPDPIVFSGINATPSGDGVQGLLSVYRGVNRAQPVNDYQVHVDLDGQQDVTQATTATPAVTTTVANTLLIAGLSPDSAIDAPVISMWPSGFTENQLSVVNPPHPYPYGWANIYSAERHLAAASSVPTSSFVWTLIGDTRYFGSLAFVLALAPE